MRTLVIGATGATGKLLVADLLNRGNQVTAIVRESGSLKASFGQNPGFHEVPAQITAIAESQLVVLLQNCDAVFSCLGHNITARGIFGKPRRLVTQSLEKLCRAIESVQPDSKVRVILMSSSGCSNGDVPESPPWSQRIVTSLLRLLVPPHADNEQAADFLRTEIGQNHRFIEWVAVRPDSLVNDSEVSEYAIHASPIRNAIFDAGSVSRINVARFMADLASHALLWETWKGKMPVIYGAAGDRRDDSN
ncbi:MAG: NAD(P)H-binding protein [Alcanivoracaceae bacterium]|nr:NAD(P)H-binding protein [Alcanivoracaceae bacterium]